jgi:hypothetical protein
MPPADGHLFSSILEMRPGERRPPRARTVAKTPVFLISKYLILQFILYFSLARAYCPEIPGLEVASRLPRARVLVMKLLIVASGRAAKRSTGKFY